MFGLRSAEGKSSFVALVTCLLFLLLSSPPAVHAHPPPCRRWWVNGRCFATGCRCPPPPPPPRPPVRRPVAAPPPPPRPTVPIAIGCPPGQYRDKTTCTPCPAQFWKADSGPGPCVRCPRGAGGTSTASYPLLGSTTCTCFAGFSQSGSGSSLVCTRCGPGFFARPGDTTCRPCPAGSTSVAGSGTCYCNDGFSTSGSGLSLQCTACGNNTYSVANTCKPGYTFTNAVAGSSRGPTSTRPGACFMLNKGNNWFNQVWDCDFRGHGWLTSIYNSAQNGFLLNLGGSGITKWIGFSDVSTEGTFNWMHGPRRVNNGVPFTFWATGEPNNHDFGSFPRGENCVQMLPVSGRWNDLWCVAGNGGNGNPNAPPEMAPAINLMRGICESDPVSQCVPCPPNSSSRGRTGTCVCNAGFRTFGSGATLRCAAAGSPPPPPTRTPTRFPTTRPRPAGDVVCPPNAITLDGSTCVCAPGFRRSATARTLVCEEIASAGCQPGREFNNQRGVCQNCASGFYKATSGIQPCRRCPRNANGISWGSFPDPGSTTCTCMRGYSQSGTGDSLQCSRCPAGTYTAATGDATCTPCPPGSTSQPGSGSCYCLPGFSQFGSGRSLRCTACPANTFSAANTCKSGYTFASLVGSSRGPSSTTVGACYMYVNNVMNWGSHARNCEINGDGWLVTIPSNAVNRAISQMGGVTTGKWIGLTDIAFAWGANTNLNVSSSAALSSTFSWIHGGLGDFSSFRNWVSNQPDDVRLFPNTRGGNCVFTAGGFGSQWNDMWCTTRVGPSNFDSVIRDMRGVCESDPVNQCFRCPANSASRGNSSTCTCNAGFFASGSGLTLRCIANGSPTARPTRRPTARPTFRATPRTCPPNSRLVFGMCQCLPNFFQVNAGQFPPICMASPTRQPTARGTFQPTPGRGSPTRRPQAMPTNRPTRRNQPTPLPTMTNMPVANPTRLPTFARVPTRRPTIRRTRRPTTMPPTVFIPPPTAQSPYNYIEVRAFANTRCSGPLVGGMISGTTAGACQVMSGGNMQTMTCSRSGNSTIITVTTFASGSGCTGTPVATYSLNPPSNGCIRTSPTSSTQETCIMTTALFANYGPGIITTYSSTMQQCSGPVTELAAWTFTPINRCITGSGSPYRIISCNSANATFPASYTATIFNNANNCPDPGAALPTGVTVTTQTIPMPSCSQQFNGAFSGMRCINNN